ncbi:11794_t:CDS:10 [Ambispora gerdemannii]|uniref:11794_t:CDS:1 n=1 Tax=Ambispora gerdemannii TaxID=144530 RepID=A0A9N9G8Y2_9GLOM|nr:11794_t:CDS:10 [Ambispora gerdemannii]
MDYPRGNRRNEGERKKYRGKTFQCQFATFKKEDRRRDNRRPRERGREHEQQDLDQTPESHLSSLIVMLGDNTQPTELYKNIEELSKILQADFGKFSQVILKTIKSWRVQIRLLIIKELPMSSSIYATLVGLINVGKSDIAKAMVTEASETLQQNLDEGDWRGVKLIMKFLVELTNANVIQPETLLRIYGNLLSVLDEPVIKKRRADTFIKIVLSTLPYIGKRLKDREPINFEQMLNKIQSYFNARAQFGDHNYSDIILSALQPYYGEDPPYPCDDVFLILWEQIKKLSNENWECPILLRPWSKYDSVFITADQHDVKDFNLPGDSERLQYLYPEPLFKIFVGSENNSDIPETSTIEHFIINDLIRDIIDIFEINRKECIRYLKEIPSKFSSGTFDQIPQTKSAIKQENAETSSWPVQDDDMNTDDDDKEITNSWKLEKIIVEVIFEQIFKLPHPTYKPIYYHSLLTEACKALSDIFPPQLEFYTVALRNRTSNVATVFGIVLELDPLHPQLCFVRETLEKIIRYSYYERIKTTLPEEFLAIFPPSEPTTNFRYDKDHILNGLSATLLAQLRSKSTVDQIQATLEQARAFYPESSSSEQDDAIRDLFLQCVLLVGSKSFSHVLNVIERYLAILQSLNATPEARKHTVFIFLGILLDKLLNYRVIDAIAIITWVFSEDSEKDFALNNNETIQNLENSLNMVLKEQKEVLLAVFQNFTKTINNRLKEHQDRRIEDLLSSQWWFWWAYGFFREVGRAYSTQYAKFIVTLETLVITPDIDPKIENILSIIKALSNNQDTVTISQI